MRRVQARQPQRHSPAHARPKDRRRQRAIAEAERRYRELFESSPAGLFRTSLDGRIMEVNPVMAGILGYESRPLVGADYARDTRSSIVDGLSTMVTDGTLLKVYAWYDNEMGYATRMVDLACHLESVGI